MSLWRQIAFSIDARTVTRTAVLHSFQPREVRSLLRCVRAQVKAALTAGQQEMYGEQGVSTPVKHDFPPIKR